MNYEKFKWVVLGLLLIWLIVVVSTAEASVPEVEKWQPDKCDKYQLDDRKLCMMVQASMPNCSVLWGMLILAYHNADKVQTEIIVNQMVRTRCVVRK